MSKPPFTLGSFVELVERDTRHGRDLGRIVPEVADEVKALRERREAYKIEVSSLAPTDPLRAIARERYQDDRKTLRSDRDSALQIALQDALVTFERELTEEQFTFGLFAAPNNGGRQTYRIKNDLHVVFPAKQAAASLKQLRFVESPSRNSIVRALKEALNKKYAHAIYRFDVKSFFTSIPHKTLVEQIEHHPGFDGISFRLIELLLKEFAEIAGSPVGVPQGIGLSSQLAEFYMRDFDKRMKSFPGVLFYARYVDDVVLVLENHKVLCDAKQQVLVELEKLGLVLNAIKTGEIVADADGNYLDDKSLEYLGYRFVRTDRKLVTGLTENRQRRSRLRLQASLETWLGTSPDPASPSTGHDGLLLDRVRYLSGNTKLLNSKSNVAIGLYFSNSALDEGAQELFELDTLLKAFIDEYAGKMSGQLRVKLRDISFVAMFKSRPFLRFHQQRIQRITQAWKDLV